MEKLIELLNRYESKLEEMPLTRERWREENGILYRRFMSVEDAERMVISKSFGFIKRLVENDKIDLRKLRKIKKDGGTYWYILLTNKNTRDLGLIMLLAISDTPIEDLISYLR